MELELLHSLSAKDILQVQKDISLMLDGYQLVYAIDNHDIVDFCFPLGIGGTDKVKSKDIVGDEYLAYNFLFSILNKKMYLPSEYLVEVLSQRTKIIEKATKIANTKASLEERFLLPILDTENDHERASKLYELEEHLSFLLSFALMAPNSVNSFLSILREKISVKLEDFVDDSVLAGIESSHKHYSADISSLFEEWLLAQDQIPYSRINNIYKNKVRNSENTGQDKQAFNYLEGIYRDITVIVSLLQVNKAFEKTRSKTLFLFHSSTPMRSRSIFDLKSLGKIFPIINGSAYDILRNKAQTYLVCLLWEGEGRSNLESLNKKLLAIYELAQKADSNERYKRKVLAEYKIKRELLEYVNQGNRSALENNLVLKQIKEHKYYQNSINKQITAFEKNKQYDFKDIVAIYENVILDAKKNIITVKAELAEMNLGLNYAIQSNIFGILLNIGTNKKIIINKGEDAIRGTFHHLPILLFYNQPFISERSKALLNPLIEYCIYPKRKRETLKKYFLNYLKNYNEYYRDKAKEPQDPSLNIISLLLTLLVPISPDGNKGVDEYAARQANVMLELYKGLSNSYAKGKSGLDYYKEMLYLKCWVARRSRDFSTSIGSAKTGIDKYKTDPRFYHGMSLALYAADYRLEEDKVSCFSSIKTVKRIISYSEKAKAYYLKGKKNNFVELTIASIDNMIAHLYTELFKLDKQKTIAYQHKSRKFLESAKEIIKKMELEYDEYPEFLQTEANLEAQESLQLEKDGKLEEAAIKIHFAEEAIGKAERLVESNKLYITTKEFILAIRKRLTKERKKTIKKTR